MFLILLLAGCSIPNPWQAQHSYAESLKPAEVKPSAETPPPAHIRIFKVRAWADRDYQAQTPRWEQSIAEQIDRANQILTAQFGVRFELDAVRSWNRTGSSASLTGPLDQLIALDKGDDVDWVIGFVSSLDVFSAAQEQLGMGPYFGRHFVLRGMFSAAETDEINRALYLLSEKERTELARERRQHKQTAVLLHEWAHTMGAFHERSPQWLMSPIYDKSQSAFSPESARIVGLGLEYRKSPASRETWGKAYRAELEKSAAVAWDAETREQSRALADRFFSGGDDPADALAPDDVKRFNDALAVREKDPTRAAALLAPLVEKYPRSDGVQSLACSIAPESAEVSATCRRAAALPGAPAQLILYVARRLLAGGDRTAAIALLVRAEEKANAREAWAALAQLDFEAGLWSEAERAAAKAHGAADQVAAECARMKSFVGFPATPLPPAREAEYVKAALAAHEDIDERRYDRALARAQEMAAAYPGTPAAAVIECRARSRGRALSLTRSACTAAAQAAPLAFYPQYILGLVASAESRWTDAGAAMRRAIEIDGGTPQVWMSLAAVELRLGHSNAARDLSVRYQARFREPLRPALWPAGWTAR
ncbi:MAG: hypothetical protein ABR567_05745 [Myxococcales bacterium]